VAHLGWDDGLGKVSSSSTDFDWSLTYVCISLKGDLFESDIAFHRGHFRALSYKTFSHL
jgi:hypothetical protein